MIEPTKRYADLRKFRFPAALFFLLLYLVFTHSIPAGFTKSMPSLALALQRNNSVATVELADQILSKEMERRESPDEGPQPPADLESVRQTLRKAILKDPLNATAFRQLGQIAALENDSQTMQRMMRISASLSLHESGAISALLRASLAANKPLTALYYADILMRSSTDALKVVAPIVVRMFEIDTVRAALIKKLGEDPPWRKDVFAAIRSSDLADPRTPLDIFLALKQTAHPPVEPELFGYLNYLLARRHFVFAYASWVQFLPEREIEYVAHVFNGSFERNPSGAPFDWLIGKGKETRAAIFPRPDKENDQALSVNFGQSRTVLPPIRQIIALPPGNYRFKGSLQGELTARRGLQWQVRCSQGLVAGQSDMLVGRRPNWQTFEFDITIPKDKCDGQYLQLIHMARTPSEQFASGGMWFDDISITKAEGDASTAP